TLFGTGPQEMDSGLDSRSGGWRRPVRVDCFDAARLGHIAWSCGWRVVLAVRFTRIPVCNVCSPTISVTRSPEPGLTDPSGFLLSLVPGSLAPARNGPFYALQSYARLLRDQHRDGEATSSGHAICRDPCRNRLVVGPKVNHRQPYCEPASDRWGDRIRMGALLRAGGVRRPSYFRNRLGPRLHARSLYKPARIFTRKRATRPVRVCGCKR